jgi:hypothetical protein
VQILEKLGKVEEKLRVLCGKGRYELRSIDGLAGFVS